jgi:hypothetical protein
LGPEAVVSLLQTILFAAESRPDGNLAGLDDEEIELAADWSGESGAFVAALAEVGFLDGPQGGRAIHDWAEHNPWAATRSQRIDAARAAATKRWDAVRAGSERSAGPSGTDAARTTEPCAPHLEGMRPAQNGNALLSSPLLSSPPHQERDRAADAAPLSTGSVWDDWRDEWNAGPKRRQLPLTPVNGDIPKFADVARRYPDAGYRRRLLHAYFASTDKQVLKNPFTVGWFLHWADKLAQDLEQAEARATAERKFLEAS